MGPADCGAINALSQVSGWDKTTVPEDLAIMPAKLANGIAVVYPVAEAPSAQCWPKKDTQDDPRRDPALDRSSPLSALMATIVHDKDLPISWDRGVQVQ